MSDGQPLARAAPGGEPPPDATVALVVPCYKESRRLGVEAFLDATGRYPWLHLLFVDDGSRDDTFAVLESLAERAPGRVSVRSLPTNAGKAEAVRQGLLHALEAGHAFVGYWDADLSTPFDALPDFLQVFRAKPRVEVILGSRVMLLGRTIRRKAARHYVGRLFATGASLVLDLPVYDTQCGAKIFRATDRLREVFRKPFTTRWLFDVEMLGRYVDACRDGAATEASRDLPIYELALRSWIDEPGSKVRARDGLRAAADLLRLYWLRRKHGGPSERAVKPQAGAG
jgi:glycosyltransferase involved in cell wall biosynthesis